MKISELQKLLTRAKETHGDLEVNVLKKTSMMSSDYFVINTVNVVRSGKSERVEVGEPLSELGEVLLHLDYIPPEDEEPEDEEEEDPYPHQLSTLPQTRHSQADTQ